VVEIPEMFRVTAKAVIFLNDKVMLLRKHTGKWDLPGGRLGYGEEVETCLTREVVEEIGLAVIVGPLIECNLRRLQDPKRSVIVVTHLCTLNGTSSDIVLSTEHAEFRLFNDHEIDSLDMRTAYRKPVQKAFNQRMAALNTQNTSFKAQSPIDNQPLFKRLMARLFSS